MKKALTLTAVFLIIVLARWVAFPERATGSIVDRASASGMIVAPRAEHSREQQVNDQADGGVEGVLELAEKGIRKFVMYSGFRNATPGHLIMIGVGLFFIFLAIRYNYEPLLLIPIGIGIIFGNIPFFQAEGVNMQIGIYQEGSVLNYLYFGVLKGVYPPLIFLGIGAMTDFSSLISKPKLMLLGAAAQVGIFLTFLGALALGFHPQEAGAIGIIGGADGPTAIFLSSRLANGVDIIGTAANGDPVYVKNLIGPIAIAAYSYMALVPVIQPPIMRLLTTRRERLIRMKPPRAVSKLEKILFPLIGLLVTTFISPNSLPLLGMLFFGNLLKESGVTKRLAETSRTSLIDIVTIMLGLTVGASTQADRFLTTDSLVIFGLGAISFMTATAGGVVFAKVMNLFSSEENKMNPLIGAAGVSAVPDSARVVQTMGLKGGSHQPPADARHGPQCGGCHRIGCCSRDPAKFPAEVTRIYLIPIR